MNSSIYSLIGVCVWATFVLSACGGGSSPARGNDPTVLEGLKISFEDMGALNSVSAQIRELIASTYDTADAVIGVEDVEVKVSADASRTIPGWGIGGYALGPDTIEIVIDPNFPNLNQTISDRLPYIVAHELHHAVRWRSQGVYTTLLQAFVFEGLADDFAVELLGATEPPWITVFSEDTASTYFDDALDELDGAFNFEAWFFGVNSSRPQWTGYTLGYLLIQRYRLLNPGSELNDLLITPTNSFRSAIEDAT